MMSLQVQARIYRPWKMMRAACLLFWLTALAARAEPPSIDNANFGEVVTASRQPFVIEFYSEMCGSCKEFAPTWHAFAARLESVAGLGLGRVCVDKPPGVKLASSLDGLFDGASRRSGDRGGDRRPRGARLCSPRPPSLAAAQVVLTRRASRRSTSRSRARACRSWSRRSAACFRGSSPQGSCSASRRSLEARWWENGGGFENADKALSLKIRLWQVALR